jgi:hypothetical protein
LFSSPPARSRDAPLALPRAARAPGSTRRPAIEFLVGTPPRLRACGTTLGVHGGEHENVKLFLRGP